MKIKRVLSLAVALVMASLLLVGCGQKSATSTQESASKAESSTAQTTDSTKATAGQTEKKDKYVIGVTMESLQDFLAYVADGCTQYGKDHPEVQVSIMDAKLDMAAQMKHVENFIAQKVNAIVIKCVDKDATGPISEKCKEAGVKLVCTNIKMNSPYDSYVGSNHKLSGKLEAEYIAKKLNGKGNIAILMGDPSHDAARDRTDAVKEVVAANPGMKVVAEQTGKWDRDKGMIVAENWIQSGLPIDAIIANNDEMAIGAIRAYEQAGKKGVLFGGIDGTKDALGYLKEGRLTVTVFQNGFQQGYKAIEAAHKLLMGENVPQYVDVPYELVPPEKADEYLAKYK